MNPGGGGGMPGAEAGAGRRMNGENLVISSVPYTVKKDAAAAAAAAELRRV